MAARGAARAKGSGQRNLSIRKGFWQLSLEKALTAESVFFVLIIWANYIALESVVVFSPNHGCLRTRCCKAAK